MVRVKHRKLLNSEEQNGQVSNFSELSDSDKTDSDHEPSNSVENDNVNVQPQQSADKEIVEWCYHYEKCEPRYIRRLLRKKLMCLECGGPAHFSCIHKDCVQELSFSCCENIAHIFSHMANRDHPIVVHHKFRLILCLQCNNRVPIRQFLMRLKTTTHCKKMNSNTIELQALTGYVNFGNTCYMNAVFQLLGHCAPFVEFMTTFQPPNGWPAYTTFGKNTTMQLAVDFRIMWGAVSVPFINPWKIIFCIRSLLPGFESFQQQDASEFLRSLLDILDREMKVFLEIQALPNVNDTEMGRFLNEPRKTIISEVFQGTLENQIICHMCGFQSRTYETFLDLSVPIVAEEEDFAYDFNSYETFDKNVVENVIDPSERNDKMDEHRNLDPGLSAHQRNDNKTSLNSCLESFFQKSTLCGDNQYCCAKCNTHVDATKTTKAKTLPEVLLIQLKRFRHTMNGTRKIDKVVEFPMNSINFDQWTTNGQHITYDLVGFIVHEGNNVEYGHYVTFIRHEQDQTWYKFDDLNVERCSSTKLAKEQPYILLFRKRQSEDISTVGPAKQPRQVEYSFINANKRFMGGCPAVWEILGKSLEKEVAKGSGKIFEFKEKIQSIQSMNSKLVEQVLLQTDSDSALKIMCHMLSEIEHAVNSRKTRKNKNSASPDSSLQAICKLLECLEQWLKQIAKSQWMERQMKLIKNEDGQETG